MHVGVRVKERMLRIKKRRKKHIDILSAANWRNVKKYIKFINIK